MSGRLVLIAVVGLLLVTELALSPFYPQLLGQLYGVDDPQTVGVLLWSSRAAALLGLALFGFLARRVPLVRLVAAGLVACVGFDVALVVAPSPGAFIVTSALAAAAGSALLLAYPALVALDEHHGPGVITFVALLHGATVVATALGAGIVALPTPRIGLLVFAIIDLVLLVLVVRVVGRQSVDAASVSRTVQGPRRAVVLVVAVTATAVVFDLAVNVARPFFTRYAEDAGLSLASAAALFLVPSLVALATLPLAHRARAVAGAALLPLALGLAAAGLLVQAISTESLALLVGRAALGAGIALAHVEIDLAMYAAVGTDGPGYAAVETVRGAALMLAPVLAAAAATTDLALPLGLGAALLGLAALLAPLLRVVHVPKEAHVPSA